MISELGNGTAPPWEANGYFANVYFDVYNNGAETLYLDGILFGVPARR